MIVKPSDDDCFKMSHDRMVGRALAPEDLRGARGGYDAIVVEAGIHFRTVDEQMGLS